MAGGFGGGGGPAEEDVEERASTPGLDTLVRRAEERLRQLQLSELTPGGESDGGAEGHASLHPLTPSAQGAQGMQAYRDLQQSLATDSACVPLVCAFFFSINVTPRMANSRILLLSL